MNAERRRPPQETAPSTSFVGSIESIADVSLRLRRADHAMFVVTGLANGRSRGRVFLTMAGAQGAVDNAKRRGQPVTVALVKLVPVQTSPADLAALLAEVTE